MKRTKKPVCINCKHHTKYFMVMMSSIRQVDQCTNPNYKPAYNVLIPESDGCELFELSTEKKYAKVYSGLKTYMRNGVQLFKEVERNGNN